MERPSPWQRQFPSAGSPGVQALWSRRFPGAGKGKSRFLARRIGPWLAEHRHARARRLPERPRRRYHADFPVNGHDEIKWPRSYPPGPRMYRHTMFQYRESMKGHSKNLPDQLIPAKTSSSRKTGCPSRRTTRIFWDSLKRPPMIISESLSSICRWIARRIGRAP